MDPKQDLLLHKVQHQFESIGSIHEGLKRFCIKNK